jgi:hypothetical protein
LTEEQIADTGFIIYRESDGSWTATTNFENIIPIAREAQMNDVKTGCRELFEAFAQNDLAVAIAEKLNAKLPAEEQTTADAIRDALQDRNIEL